MKKRKILIIGTVIFLVLCTLVLVGCSAAGSCLNCLTNTFGGMFDCVGKCNSCELSYYFWSCASCGFLCRGCDLNCRESGYNYDDLCIGTCYECGESCYSSVKTTDTLDLLLGVADGKVDMTYQCGTPVLESVSAGILRAVVTVQVTFGGEDCRYDNVSVTCTIEGIQPSTRWIGSARSGKTYEVECEYYVNTRDAIEGKEIRVGIVGTPVQ